jgi:RNA polymerase sigma factor (TIGR02999 family)
MGSARRNGRRDDGRPDAANGRLPPVNGACYILIPPDVTRSPKPRSTSRGTADPAVGALVEEVYGELRRIADRYVQRERAKSVQATELVHEAYLRLLKDPSPAWRNRTHFLAIAAISMRRLLVERARARAAAKRGGGHVQVTLDERLLAREDETIDVIAIDRALDALAAVDAQQARIVELRFFGGLSVEETADALGISPATVKRHWSVARAWLWRELEGRPAP